MALIDMTDDLSIKIKQLPEREFYLLTATYGADLGLLMTDDYDLTNEQIGLMKDLTERLYVKDLRLLDLYTQVKTLFGFDETTSRKFACDLAGYRLLPIADWLAADVANFIRSLGGDAAGYAVENDKLQKSAIADLAADQAMMAKPSELPPLIDDDPDSDDLPDDETESDAQATAEEQFEEYQQILTDNLADLLVTDDYLFTRQFNHRLIALLIEHDDWKNDLLGILLNSRCKIGSETIVLDGRQTEPTVGAWLRYFNAQKGSDMFDAVTLSDFLVNATAAKFLLARDKEILSRLLQFYRNLKFFPDSLMGDEADQWEILTYVGDPDYKLTEVLAETTVAKQPIINDPLKLEALRQMAKKYPAGSLERMVVDEEIKHVTQNM